MHNKNLEKIALSSTLIIVFGLYAFHKYSLESQLSLINRKDLVSITDSSHSYRDGRYIGKVADAYYGKLQTVITVSNTHITDVEFLQYPKGQQNSVRLNEDALLRLQTEVIAVQSDKFDAITGASLTSAAFLESLDSALSQAKI